MLLITIGFWQLVLIGVAVGVLLGLIPLVLGFVKGKRNLGFYGFIASVIGGALSSILALIIAVVFVWLILKKPGKTAAVNEVPAEIDIDNTVNR